MGADRWRRRRAERGQVLPLLALTILTMGIIALLAITFGQAVVRRQQAQMVVDAAAFAGAAEQAKGLNTIARINEKQLNLLNAIVIAQAKGLVAGYQDNYSTTISRLTCGPACGADWSSNNWFAYESTFNYLNQATKAVNVAYGTVPYVKPPLINKPVRAATKVVEDNFGPGSSIFSGESPVSHGPVIWMADVPSAATLVKLTPPGDYEAADGRHYSPDEGALTTWCTVPCLATVLPPLVAACVESCKNGQKIHYAAINVYYNAIALFSVPTYSAGQFYDNEPGRDVHFTYHLRIAGPKPLVGKSWFGDTPDMVVVASAKPYGGYLGDKFDENWDWLPLPVRRIQRFGYSQQDGKEIAYTYKARLIPVRTLEKRQLAIDMEGTNVVTDPSVFARYMSIVH
jgi:hypothetical protein